MGYYEEGTNYYRRTYHKPVEIKYKLMDTSLEAKISFLRGVLDERCAGNQDDIYRILLMVAQDIKNDIDYLHNRIDCLERVGDYE